MNRDATIVQVALFLIIIAILGVAILKQQTGGNASADDTNDKTNIIAIQEGEANENDDSDLPDSDDGDEEIVDLTPPTTKPTEIPDSVYTNTVKKYFQYIAERNFVEACRVLSRNKCNPENQVTVDSFSTEFNKQQNGYEYVSVKDYGIIAPSGKHVVCVKYSYRYKEDSQPGLISEVMSFYLQDQNGDIRITDRVCEKKYKDGRGLRECPIQAAVEFCEGKVK